MQAWVGHRVLFELPSNQERIETIYSTSSVANLRVGKMIHVTPARIIGYVRATIRPQAGDRWAFS